MRQCGDRIGLIVACVILPLVMVSCARMNAVEVGSNAKSDQIEAGAEATSLFGRPLVPPALEVNERIKRERDLERARFDYDRDPHNEQAIIWYGRRLAYLGRFREAIDVFSNGLAIHPESARLLRHRGHRFITVREFDKAIADLERAAALVKNKPDEVEPDGMPNEQNQPRSTLNSNSFYHLGLAKYLQQDWAGAAEAYRQCMGFSDNDDMRVATAYWLYLSFMRAGRNGEAKHVLKPISETMDVIENQSYHRLLLVFKGDLRPEDVAGTGDSADQQAIDDATIGYGLAMHDLFAGRHDAAMTGLKRVLQGEQWAAFGYIAAEADVARSE